MDIALDRTDEFVTGARPEDAGESRASRKDGTTAADGSGG
jgi:hypothetical protein